MSVPSSARHVQKARTDMNMVGGALFPKIVAFTIPIMLQSLLQTLYNSADTVIVGRFAGAESVRALAAVGATASLYAALVGFFIGIATGVDVVCSFCEGARDREGVRQTVDTSIVIAPLLGLLVTAVGLLLARPLLILMGTPAEGGVLDGAVRYLRILMIGVPFSMLYNFAAAVLRTAGETRRPFLYLAVAGALNVALNILFVAGFGLAEAGVAIATVISEVVSALLIFRLLLRNGGVFSFSPRRISFSLSKLRRIVSVGLLAGIQSTVFSVSNVFLQAGVNSFGDAAMAGSSATTTIENILWCTSTAPLNAATTFVSQNVGARRLDRVRRTTLYCCLLSVGLGLVLGLSGYFGATALIGLFTSSPEAIAYGLERAAITFPYYAIASLMGTLPGAIRGLGYSLSSTLISVFGACGVRIIWIYTVFARFHTMEMLFIVHPITWIITTVCLLLCYFICLRRVGLRLATPSSAPDAPAPPMAFCGNSAADLENS